MTPDNEYIFNHNVFFVGGTGGNFINSIFLFYINHKYEKNTIEILEEKFLQVSELGDCHHNPNKNLKHYIEDVNNNKQNIKIAIKFDEDDIPYISEMHYKKTFLTNDSLIESLFNKKKIKGKLLKDDEIKEIMMKTLHKKGIEHWVSNFDFNQMDLILQFKTVYGLDDKDLHSIICNFLNVERLPEIDNFILKYRNTNKKYLIQLKK